MACLPRSACPAGGAGRDPATGSPAALAPLRRRPAALRPRRFPRGSPCQLLLPIPIAATAVLADWAAPPPTRRGGVEAPALAYRPVGAGGMGEWSAQRGERRRDGGGRGRDDSPVPRAGRPSGTPRRPPRPATRLPEPARGVSRGCRRAGAGGARRARRFPACRGGHTPAVAAWASNGTARRADTGAPGRPASRGVLTGARGTVPEAVPEMAGQTVGHRGTPPTVAGPAHEFKLVPRAIVHRRGEAYHRASVPLAGPDLDPGGVPTPAGQLVLHG